MAQHPLKVAWISYFPAEWLPHAPEPIGRLPKRHPASWLQTGVEELKNRAELNLHVIELRKELDRDICFEQDGVQFHCLKVPGGWRAPSLFWIDTLLIRRKLQSIQPDVVHAWGTEKGAALVASRLPYPYLVSLQGLLECFSNLVKLSFYERFAARLERRSLKRAKVATGESRFVIDWLQQHYPHLQLHHVEHSPASLFFSIKRRPHIKPIQFLFVGTATFRKGTDLLVMALDRLKGELDFRMTFVGLSSPFLAEMKTRTSPQLWERIQVLESPPTSSVIEQLSRATMVLFPTRADTGPVAVKEAVVAGVPVVGTRMGGIPDYISPGKNGLLVPPGELEPLVQAIREACAHPLLGQGLVDADQLARVRRHLAPQQMGEGFLNIYRHLAHPDGEV